MKKLLTINLFLLTSLFTFGQIINIPDDYPAIQVGIDAATDGDTVLVAQGMYYENINFLGKAITLASHYLVEQDSSHILNTIIDGGQPVNPDSASVVYFYSGEDTTSILCGFTIQNGTGTYPNIWGSKSGGGIFCENSGAKIIHNRIINNEVNSTTTSAYGGGFNADTCTNRTIIIRYNTIENNTVTTYSNTNWASGGGGRSDMTAIIQHNDIINNTVNGYAHGAGLFLWKCSGNISHNHIENNHVNVTVATLGDGGGIQVNTPYSGLTITQNTIINNQCTGGNVTYGGGIGIGVWSEDYEYYIDRNIIKGNTADIGGGICIRGSTHANVTNNIIQDNDAIEEGGGIFFNETNKEDLEYYPIRGKLKSSNNNKDQLENSIPIIVNNTIIENTAGIYGGGIMNKLANWNILAFNNIFYDNSAAAGAEVWNHIFTSTTYLYNNNIDINLIEGSGAWTGENNIFVDPEFDEDGFHLLPESQCIEAGITSLEILEETFYCPEFDIDNELRPYNNSIDIGADEYYPTVSITESANSIDSQFLQNFPNPFIESTTITFELKSDCYTDLSIYDLSGKKILTLVKDYKQSGIHELELNAEWLDKGIYFCVLKTNKRIQTAKMIKLD